MSCPQTIVGNIDVYNSSTKRNKNSSTQLQTQFQHHIFSVSICFPNTVYAYKLEPLCSSGSSNLGKVLNSGCVIHQCKNWKSLLFLYEFVHFNKKCIVYLNSFHLFFCLVSENKKLLNYNFGLCKFLCVLICERVL